MSGSPERIDLRTITPQPWKNGAGLTREIAFGGASSSDFDWRISLAEVAHDAPFSAFAGIDRCIVLLRGAGMQLRSTDGAIDHALTTPLVPFRFAGDVALDASLVDGPSSAFNVMTRRGVWRSDVRILQTDGCLRSATITLALCIGGTWEIDGMTLAAMRGVLLPLPPGEGGGEGTCRASRWSSDATRFARPHPDPLPEAEGAREGVSATAALLVVHLDREPSP